MAADIQHLAVGSGGTDGLQPLIIDLDGTLLRTDTLYEAFAAAIFQQPLKAALASGRLFVDGKASFKRSLCEIIELDVATLPLREDLVEYMREEAARGRPIHLATAADRSIADAMARRIGIFSSIHASENGHNLKSGNKAARLGEAFPDGFVYAGDCEADLAVWDRSSAAIVVSADGRLADRVAKSGTPIERTFRAVSGGWRAWAKAARPHQWAKNVLVMAPVILGLHSVTSAGALTAIVAMGLLCLLASLTYILNDIADLSSDRRHWSKRNRPFASGALPVRQGLIAAGVGIPVILGLGFWLSPGVGLCLAAYLVVTLAYSLGLKRVPMLDVTIIAVLFTLRLALGMTAAGLAWSEWFLVFSMFFFFSLAIAKRHTELLRAAQTADPQSGSGKVHGRGYHLEDNDVTFAFGVCGSFASIVILVLYLTDEVFARGHYPHPGWLWLTPLTIFLWTTRIWLLAHRGEMLDDPVIFALRDRISLALGAVIAVSFALALV